MRASGHRLSLCMACVLCLLAGAARAQPPAARVTIGLSQPRVTHEPGREITVHLAVQDASGRPAVGIRPVLDVSTGSLGPLEEGAPGEFAVRYRVPPERHPQPVLFAAKVPGQEPVWTVLAICGRTELPVDSDKPSVQVTLRIGGRAYGPIRTDEQGRVRIPVEVCPADAEAVAEALDEFGNRTRKTVAIPIPPSPVLVGFAEKKSLAADGADGSDIFLVAIGPDGRPVPRITFLATRTTGAVSPVRRLAPGLYRLRYTAPAGLSSREAVLTITTKEFPGLGKREFRFTLAAGAPAELSLSARPETLLNDGRTAVDVELLVRDAGGNGLVGLSPQVACDGQPLLEVRDAGAGVYRARFSPPPGRFGEIECRAEVSGREPPLAATKRVTLDRPAPGRMRLRLVPDVSVADGQTTVGIEIELWDERDRPLAGEAIELSVPLGKPGPVIDEGAGRYRAQYRVPHLRDDTRVRLRAAVARKPEVDAAAVLELSGPKPPPPPAPRLTLGAFAGLTSNFGRLLYGQFWLEAALRLPRMGDAVFVALESGYRAGQKTADTALAGFSVRVRAELIPLHVLLLLRLRPHSEVTPLLMAGGGVQFWKWSQRGENGLSSAQVGTVAGALVGLGLEWRLGPGALAFQLRYHYAYLSTQTELVGDMGQEGPRANGNLGGLEASLGYRMFF